MVISNGLILTRALLISSTLLAACTQTQATIEGPAAVPVESCPTGPDIRYTARRLGEVSVATSPHPQGGMLLARTYFSQQTGICFNAWRCGPTGCSPLKTPTNLAPPGNLEPAVSTSASPAGAYGVFVGLSIVSNQEGLRTMALYCDVAECKPVVFR